ncbi:TetR/AcrR family transcriptional regulator [Chelatococcus reniformis]|uniref:HTH tetR-type domain-containing protein n=1 Tax=Chelatococcus reniformis TaxID=1494448 RepID=A0A916U4R2_9HYPH|nr:TetR/AcrR family transcriptional regulator [Chelatococcus reniformis]GGC59950.1 hypothetical protein GCM10010994_18320 [Chelatococcus reniformis]
MSVREATAVESSYRRGGRPTRAEAAERDARLIEIATSLFMERGFEATSIDALAEAARVSKPTVYARYRDKRELFAAVLRRQIERWLVPLSASAQTQVDVRDPVALEAMLVDVARQMVALSSTPGSIALSRILSAQAPHFPELTQLAFEEGWLKAVGAMARMLSSVASRGLIRIDDPALAADLFLSLILGPVSRHNGYCADPLDAGVDERLVKAVGLFLNGVLPRR